jgi:ABC-type branched-subunit amino acid transport system ATPase component/ABC-type branched-subunit amino acid transport system permease subunit
MTIALQFAFLGLGSGAIYAILAQGIVVTFRGSGVLNLAQGAIAMVVAFTFNSLHAYHGWALAPALVVGTAMGAFIGWLVDQLVLRRLRRSSPIARLIATLGVLLVTESIGVKLWGATPILALPLITPHEVTIFGATTTSYQLVLMTIAVLLTVALTTIWHRTRLGWVAEAVAENERSAAALGWSPERVSAWTWATGGALGGLAGILISPIAQLSVTTLTLSVIFALAAALVGGFRSFPLTLLGGVIVGVAQAEAGNYVHIVGFSDALPFLFVIAVLVVRGSALPLRGHIADRLPRVSSGRVDWRLLAPAVALVAVGLALVHSSDWQAALTSTFAVATVILSIVVLTGYAGQVSLGQAAIAGLGALLAARLAQDQQWSFELCLVAGATCASVVGLVFALPALRTRGVNLAVVTLGLGLAVQSVVFNNPTFTEQSGVNVSHQRLFGLDINPLGHATRYLLVCLLVFVLCAVAAANLRRGRSGRRLLAVRANERAAAATGINAAGAKAQAFAVSGAIAGIGGVLMAFSQTTATFDVFNPFTSIQMVGEAVIGGVGYAPGAIVGALADPSSVGSVLALHWQSFAAWIPIIAGVGLLVTLIANPDGIVAAQMHAFYRRLGRLHPASVGARPRGAAHRVPPRALDVSDVTVRFGATVAVDSVSLQVAPGEVVGLIGPNGAGKTSLMDAISGFAPATGQVRVGETSVERWSPDRRARAGLVRSFQSLELFDDMSVRENLQVAGERRDFISIASDLIHPGQAELSPAAAAAVSEFELEEILDRLPTEIAYGQRRLVGVARAVATEASILLLDEPAAGLDEHESREFARLVRRLADDWGMAVLVIEHDMAFVMTICDRVTVLDFGRPIVTGRPDEISRSAAARAAYLGEAAESAPLVASPDREHAS